MTSTAARGRVVVLFSGGRDSTCLLDLAVRLAGAGDGAARQLRAAGGRGRRRGALPRAVRAPRRAAARPCGAGARSGNVQAWAREVRYAAARRLADGTIPAGPHRDRPGRDRPVPARRLAGRGGRSSGCRRASGRLVPAAAGHDAGGDRPRTASSAGWPGARTPSNAPAGARVRAAPSRPRAARAASGGGGERPARARAAARRGGGAGTRWCPDEDRRCSTAWPPCRPRWPGWRSRSWPAPSRSRSRRRHPRARMTGPLR